MLIGIIIGVFIGAAVGYCLCGLLVSNNIKNLEAANKTLNELLYKNYYKKDETSNINEEDNQAAY